MGDRLQGAAGVAASILLVSGCGGGGGGGSSGSTTTAPRLAPYANGYLSFERPSGWTAYPFRWKGVLNFQPMVYLSTEPVHDPCRSEGKATVCDWPIRRLRADGVLVVWENRGYPGWSLRTQAGSPLRVGGRRAKRTTTRPGVCGAIGGELTVEIAIESPLPSNWTQATAFLRGPRLAQNERRFDALLASTRFLSG